VGLAAAGGGAVEGIVYPIIFIIIIGKVSFGWTERIIGKVLREWWKLRQGIPWLQRNEITFFRNLVEVGVLEIRGRASLVGRFFQLRRIL
jgi:hypothetical protein